MREHLLIIGAADIAAIRFECAATACGGSVSISPDYRLAGPVQCPQCGKPMASDQTIFKLVSGLTDGIRQARQLSEDAFKVRLVLKEPER